ncbi:MAG: two-component sensor histidine kinase [Lachnospiraceae bacterium]|nr:two-component sensor histidine kinase [Lachnospiraceae bacterium]
MLRKRMNFFNSVRFRIMIIMIALGIAPSMIIAKAVTHSYEKRAVSLRISNVRNQCDILCNQLVDVGYMENPKSNVIEKQLELLSNVYSGRILLINNYFKIVKDTYGLDEGKTVIAADVIRCMDGELTSNHNKENDYLELTIALKKPGQKDVQGVMLVSISAGEISSTVEFLKRNGILFQGIVTLIVVVFSYIASRILVKPFNKITKAIEEITDGYQKGDIFVKDYTETELITDAFNKMLNRMKILDESRQEFVSNVSHELKTPMTSMKVLADSLVGQENVPEELYQEFLQDITAEIDRESKIITDLLSLVKLDKRVSDLRIEHLNINDLLELILKRLRPIADKRNIDLILDSFRPVEADVDEVKFTLAISNLVENGIKYNVDDGWVRVSLDADHKYFYVTVSDSGMGIPEESLGKIFERFYRVDKSHSREIGGTGLGLSITRSAIVMHHGTVNVNSREEEGTTFTVRIPLLYIP